MSETSDEQLVAMIRDALHMVIDPELGYNIVGLGLIYRIAVRDGNTALITMTTTTRGCPATDYLKSGAHDAACTVTGIESAEVELTYDPPWNPQMMLPDAKAHFGF